LRKVRASQRIAWLLRVNRLFGHDTRWAKANQFSDAFRGGCWPTAISGSTISRWENNLIRVPYLAVGRYEELLELPPGALVSVIDLVNRYEAPPVGGPSLLDRGFGRDRDAALRRLDGLLDKLTSSEIATGYDWDELTTILSTFPEIVLVPSSTWGELSRRLMPEMMIADGLPRMRRFESLNRLLGHPIGQQAAIATCASMAVDNAHQVIIEAISALDGTGHPDGSRRVLAQLTNPTSDPAFYGALLACVRKTRHGHMTPRQVDSVARIADDLIAGPTRHDDAQVLAAQILHQLPERFRAGISSGARRGLAANQPLHTLVTAGRLGISASPVLARIIGRATALLPGDPSGFRDELLPVLLEEMLFHPVLDTRLYSGMLIEATPYKRPLALMIHGDWSLAWDGCRAA
jgi:hypothetical protein